MSSADSPASAGLEELRNQVEDLRVKNTKLQHSLDDALSEIAVASCVKEDLIELDRQRTVLNDEKKTLESLLIEAQDEAQSTTTRYEHECARMRAVIEQLEVENRELKSSKQGINVGGGDLLLPTATTMESGSSALMDKETLSVLSDATKSLARRVKSNLSFSKLQQQQMSDDSSETSPMTAAPDPTGIQRAYEDAEVLKAIVVPLEEQIGALKGKLRETDSMLQEFERNQSGVLYSAQVLGEWLASKKSFAEALEELEKKSQLESSNKQACNLSSTVLTTLLNARLSLVVKELNELRLQNERNQADLERSLKKCGELRSQTAEANGRLLKCQQKHALELARVASVLSEDQKLQLSSSASFSTDLNSDDAMQVGCNDQCQTNSTVISPELVINRAEWESLQSELDKMRALMGVGLDVDVVGSDQFKKLQAQLQEYRAKVDKQSKREEKLKGEMELMERQFNQRAEDYQSQALQLSQTVVESQTLLSQLQTSYQLAFEELKSRLHSLSTDRDRIVGELRRLQIENEELLGKREAKAEELREEVINLPEKMEDMHLLLLTYREQLISAKLASEHHEEKRKQVRAELSAENESLKERLVMLDSCQSELDVMQKRCLEIEGVAKNLRKEKGSLEKQVDNSAVQKARAEGQVAELKGRVSNLQQELDNSVAVQTDFVRLSQSLQMELEKIRQSENEVFYFHAMLRFLLNVFMFRCDGNMRKTLKIVQAATNHLTLPRGSTIVDTVVEYFVLIALPKASVADLIRGRLGSAKYVILCKYIVIHFVVFSILTFLFFLQTCPKFRSLLLHGGSQRWQLAYIFDICLLMHD